MCGIVGFADRSATDASGHVSLMTGALRHRGPDDEGRWFDANAGLALGHRRLRILDLSPLGHQPMLSSSGRYVITYNGEVYNFHELAAELRTLGCTFRGRSDTEVMLSAFETWGLEDAISKFVGMFAFALWDARERVLHLVRDRLGVKPLYYGWRGSAFLFASELKGIIAYPGKRFDVDRAALSSFLRFSYIPAPRSVFQGIHKLPQGCVLSLRERDLYSGGDGFSPFADDASARLHPRSYWRADAAVQRSLDNHWNGNEAETCEELERVLREAVRVRMISDVPLGVFLSGGVDSTAITALMQAEAPAPVRTFTVGFEDRCFDEAPHARAIARHLGTDHTEMRVTGNDALDVLPRLPSLFDEPFGDSSQIPTHLIARLARQHVTVVLGGDGGDELLGGYDRYRIVSTLRRTTRWIPAMSRRVMASALTAVSPEGWDGMYAVMGKLLPSRRRAPRIGDRVHKLADLLRTDSSCDIHERLTALAYPDGIPVLGYSAVPAFNGDGTENASIACSTVARTLSPAEQLMLRDLTRYLPDDILVKVDRASMGASLEVRAPFLDHRVVEFLWRLPVSQRLGGGRKRLLRRIVEKYVPLSLLDRPKMGFGVPVASWLRSELRDWAEDLLSERRLRDQGYLKPRIVQSLWYEHLRGRRNRHHQLWNTLMFQAWLDEYKHAL